LLKMLADVSISTKLGLGYATVFFGLVIVVLTALSGFREISANQQAIYEKDMPAAILLVHLSNNIHRVYSAGQMLTMARDVTVKDKQIEEIFVVRKENSEIFPKLRALFSEDSVAADVVVQMEKQIGDAYEIADNALKSGSIDELSDEQKSQQLKFQRQKLNAVMVMADKVEKLPNILAEHRMQSTRLRINNQVVMFTLSTAFIVLLSFGQMLLLQRDILKPLKSLTEAARAIEEGNLDIQLQEDSRKDELGILQRSFCAMQLALRKRTDDLSRAINSLNESNSELQHFAYVAAHDLQEPLRTVVSYLGLLEKRLNQNLDEKSKKYIVNAISGAERMRALIRGLLEVARITTKAKPYVMVSCNTILEEIVDDLRVYLNEQGGTVVFGALPVVLADRTQLAQVFQNLIQNAIKFRTAQAPVVEITCESSSAFWTFHVKDNGIGMKMEYAERIFAIFQRLHTATEYSGTGIGLAVCKKIVERHGGKIWVESEEGKGSVFSFTIAKQHPL